MLPYMEYMDPMGITSAHTIVAISEHFCNCPVGAAKSDSVDYNVLIDKWICVKSLGYVLQLSKKKRSVCARKLNVHLKRVETSGLRSMSFPYPPWYIYLHLGDF